MWHVNTHQFLLMGHVHLLNLPLGLTLGHDERRKPPGGLGPSTRLPIRWTVTVDLVERNPVRATGPCDRQSIQVSHVFNLGWRVQ